MKYNGERFIEVMNIQSHPKTEVYHIREEADGTMWLITSGSRLFKIENNVISPYKYNATIRAAGESLQLITDFFVHEGDSVDVSVRYSGQYRIYEDGSYVLLPGQGFKMDRHTGGRWSLGTPCLKSDKDLPKISDYYHFDLTDQKGKSYTHNLLFDKQPHNIRPAGLHPYATMAVDRHVMQVRGDSLRTYSSPSVISALAPGLDGETWVGTFKNGIKRLSSDHFEEMDINMDFLGHSVPSSILVDAKGNLWIGTDGNGLYRVPEGSLSKMSYQNEIDRVRVTSIAQSESHLYVSYYNGALLSVEKKSNSHTLDYPIQQKKYGISDILVKDDLLYLTSIYGGGLFSFDGQKAELVPSTEQIGYRKLASGPDDKIYSFFLYAFSSIQDSIVNYQGNKLQQINPEFPSAVNFYGTYEDSTIGHCILTSHGVWQIDADNSIAPHPEFSKLSDREIEFLKVDDNLVVCANSFEGVFGYQNDQYFELNVSHGLISNQILSLEMDAQNVYIGTNDGLVIAKTESLSSALEKTTVLNKKPIRALMLGEQFVWIGTDVGLFKQDVTDISYTSTPPSISLTQVSVNSEPFEFEPSRVLEFDHDATGISFNFESTDISNSGPFEYNYQIAELDPNQWSKSTNGTVQFAGIEPGNYTLNVYSKRRNGEPSALVNIPFTVQTPFYKTKSFIILNALALALLFILYGRYRQRKENLRLQRENRQAYYKQQALSSRMNPHFIFNGLNSLQDLVIKGDKRQSLDYLTKLSSLMRKNIAYAKEEMIPLQQEIALLKNYCELETMRFDDQLDCEFVTEGVDEMKCLVPSMILQPLVENALWHGLRSVDEKRLQLSFKKIDDDLIIKVTDNGIGRAEAKKRVKYASNDKERSHALSFIRARLELFTKIFGRDFSLTMDDVLDEEQKVSGTMCTVVTPYITESLREQIFDDE